MHSVHIILIMTYYHLNQLSFEHNIEDLILYNYSYITIITNYLML